MNCDRVFWVGRRLKRKYELYLDDIIESIDRIRRYLEGHDKEAFEANELIRDAVMRNLYIIGEAVVQLPDEIKHQYQSVPWKKIRGFRNIAAHRYWKINIDRVWDILENKLDELKSHVQRIKDDID